MGRISLQAHLSLAHLYAQGQAAGTAKKDSHGHAGGSYMTMSLDTSKTKLGSLQLSEAMQGLYSSNCLNLFLQQGRLMRGRGNASSPPAEVRPTSRTLLTVIVLVAPHRSGVGSGLRRPSSRFLVLFRAAPLTAVPVFFFFFSPTLSLLRPQATFSLLARAGVFLPFTVPGALVVGRVASFGGTPFSG